MSEFVRSLGGPILLMDMATWEKWGGSASNSATGFSGTDYDFVCHSTGYISKATVQNKQVLILNDMPMDTGIVENAEFGSNIIRIMDGDIDDSERFLSNHATQTFNPKNQVDEELIEEFIVDTGDLVLVESTARVASFNKGDCLGFKLDSGVYAIKTYDYANDVVRVIVHRLLPS